MFNLNSQGAERQKNQKVVRANWNFQRCFFNPNILKPFTPVEN